MTDRVDSTEIESIVGASRHETMHIVRWTPSGIVYILHSQHCRERHEDLRQCEYSHALDRGLEPIPWDGHRDTPTQVRIFEGKMVPRC